MPRARPDVIGRRALDAELERALARAKLVLLMAPAGYGKTTALVQQLSRNVRGRVHAWVNVSEDDDLSSLLAGMLQALDPLDLPWRQSPEEWPSQVLTEQGLATVTVALQQALEHAEAAHGVIVLDDLHRLGDPRAHAFLDLLVARLSPRWTLAVTSRQRPPLALARLRLQGELAEFGQVQLRFGPQDLRILLSRQSPDADDDSAEQLYRATQGWPVGAATMGHALKLAVGAPGRRDRRRRMFDYLAAEVLNELPPPMREFLLRCSVLRELTAARCVQVSADERAARWLDELERRDLFVSVLDTDDHVLRLHDLFREFLEARLLLEHPGEYRQLLLRAAEAEPDFARRIGLCLRAGASELALTEVMEHAADIVLRGCEADLLRVIEQFHATVRAAAPELNFARGVCAWHRFRWQTMAHAMLAATGGFERQGKLPQALQARAFAVVALIQGGRVDEALRLWKEAPRSAENERSRVACLISDYMTSLMNGPAEGAPARLWRLVEALGTREGLRWMCFQPAYTVAGGWGIHAPTAALARAMGDAARDDHPRLKTSAMLLEAWRALWRVDLDRLNELREQLERDSHWLGEPLTLRAPLLYMLAFEKHVTDDPTFARRLMRGLSDAAGGDPERRSMVLYRHLDALFASANGEWADALALRAQLASAEPSWPIVPIALAALDAELALARGDAQAAVQGTQPLLDRVADVDSLATHTRLRVALARAQCRLGQVDAAWRVLAPVLEELRRSGETLGLLILGPGALHELAAAAWPTASERALIELLLGIAEHARELRSPAHPTPGRPEVPALVEHERHVLELIARGLSNKLIASELGLSPHVVKRCVARILERTGQASRAAAAAWFRRHASEDASGPSGLKA
jgi:LuxR family maltose regulon positive regulatory protein